MAEYLAGLTGLEKVYLGCAVFGGGLFLLRTLLMLIGADAPDSDMDMDLDAGDIDVDAGDIDDSGHHGGHDADIDSHDGELDAGLKLLTFQGLTAFAMMFGLAGFSVSQSSTLGAVFTLGIGCATGVLAMWIVAKGFALMRTMQSVGTMNLYDAMGEEGTVYLTIPPEGTGKVQVIVSGRLKVMDAVSQDQEELKTGARVCVSDISNNRILVVQKI